MLLSLLLLIPSIPSLLPNDVTADADGGGGGGGTAAGAVKPLEKAWLWVDVGAVMIFR